MFLHDKRMERTFQGRTLTGVWTMEEAAKWFGDLFLRGLTYLRLPQRRDDLADVIAP
jgi:hypothetical protein